MPEAVNIDEKILQLTRTRKVTVPPYPAVALKLNEVTSSQSFAISDVVDVVSADQTLTATILRAANSALFATMGSVTTLQQAVTRLGASEVSRLALAAGLAESMRLPGGLQSLRRQTWAEGVASASVSHTLARLRALSQRDAFTCGLLHDFGKLVGIACLEQVLQAHPEIGASSEETWRASLARVLPQLSAIVATTWNLPPLLEQAMTLRSPEARARSIYGAMLEVVAVSDEVVARMMQTSRLEASDLASVRGLLPNELEPLAEVLPEVPATINAFESELPPKPAISKVTQPQTSLAGAPLHPISLPVNQLKPVQRGPFQMVGISSIGWVMVGAQALPERQMFEAQIAVPAVLALGARPAAPASLLKLWASTTLCFAEGGRFRIECKPFALDREGKRRWAELVLAAKPG